MPARDPQPSPSTLACRHLPLPRSQGLQHLRDATFDYRRRDHSSRAQQHIRQLDSVPKRPDTFTTSPSIAFHPCDQQLLVRQPRLDDQPNLKPQQNRVAPAVLTGSTSNVLDWHRGPALPGRVAYLGYLRSAFSLHESLCHCLRPPASPVHNRAHTLQTCINTAHPALAAAPLDCPAFSTLASIAPRRFNQCRNSASRLTISDGRPRPRCCPHEHLFFQHLQRCAIPDECSGTTYGCLQLYRPEPWSQRPQVRMPKILESLIIIRSEWYEPSRPWLLERIKGYGSCRSRSLVYVFTSCLLP